MSNARLAVLTDEFTAKRSFLDTLDQTAADEKRDLTEDERGDYDAAITRMEAIGADIDGINKRQERFDAVAAKTAQVGGVTLARTQPRPTEAPSLGEQLLIRAKHSLGKDSNVGGVDYDTLQRAVTHGVSTDGTSPTTIEGDLIKFVDASRNAVNSARRLPMPDNHASTFTRPRFTTNTSVAVQTNEGDILSSTRPVNVKDTVTKKTYGGVLALSEQEIDWTDPAMLGLAVQDLAEQYGIVTDDVLCTAIETASTASVQTVLSLTAASDVFVKGIAAAANIAYGTSKKLPNVLYAAVDRWAYIAALTDGDGRPMFPVSNVINSAGTNSAGVTSFSGLNVLGLNVVVDPNFTTGFLAVAVSNLVECYEQNKGLLTIAAPSTLETQIAYRGYFATNVYSQGFGALETS